MTNAESSGEFIAVAKLAFKTRNTCSTFAHTLPNRRLLARWRTVSGVQFGTPLFDHLVDPKQDRVRQVNPQRVRRSAVQGHLEFHWKSYRQVGRVCTTQDAIGIRRGATVAIAEIWPIRNKPPSLT